MRIERSVMSVSWIPSEAVTGMTKAAFGVGVTHYDDPPPDVIEDLEALRANDGFRFANVLRGWVDVEGGRIVGAGYADDSKGRMGTTTVRFATKGITFAAHRLPRAPPGPRDRRDVGPLRADLRRPHGAPVAPPGQPPAVRPVEAAARVDDARARDPRRRPQRVQPHRREHVPASLGVRRRGQARTARPGSPTSRSGTCTRSGSTRRGATRTPPRS